jgi:hypothetical protein
MNAEVRGVLFEGLTMMQLPAATAETNGAIRSWKGSFHGGHDEHPSLGFIAQKVLRQGEERRRRTLLPYPGRRPFHGDVDVDLLDKRETPTSATSRNDLRKSSQIAAYSSFWGRRIAAQRRVSFTARSVGPVGATCQR